VLTDIKLVMMCNSKWLLCHVLQLLCEQCEGYILLAWLPVGNGIVQFLSVNCKHV
jgi:hypothetical protein